MKLRVKNPSRILKRGQSSIGHAAERRQRGPLPFDCPGAAPGHRRRMTALDQAEQELAEAQQALVAQTAVVRGLQERVRYLKRHAQPADPSGLNRVGAILAILESAGVPLTIGQGVDRLVASGRTGDTHKLVSATLSYLHGEGKVRRAGRGRYAA